MGLIEHRFGDGGIVIDDRLSPVIINTWWGSATMEAVDAFFEWSDPFYAERTERGEKTVLITDALDAQRPPATIRRHIAMRTEATRTDERDALLLGNLVVVGSAAVRGALTAIGWFSERRNTMVPVKNIVTAFEVSADLLRKAKLEVPAGLDATLYRRPVPTLGRVEGGLDASEVQGRR